MVIRRPIAFGTFTDCITGRDRAEEMQWRNVWPHIDEFRWRPDLRVMVSPDRMQAVGMGAFAVPIAEMAFQSTIMIYPSSGQA